MRTQDSQPRVPCIFSASGQQMAASAHVHTYVRSNLEVYRVCVVKQAYVKSDHHTVCQPACMDNIVHPRLFPGQSHLMEGDVLMGRHSLHLVCIQ